MTKYGFDTFDDNEYDDFMWKSRPEYILLCVKFSSSF